MADRRRWVAAGVGVAASGVAVLACVGACVGVPCLSTGLWYGAWADRCPDGRMRLGLEVNGSLLRGEEGTLDVAPILRWLDADGDRHTARAWRFVDRTLELRDPSGKPVATAELRDVGHGFEVKLPRDLPDGDYVAHVTASLGEESVFVDVNVPLFAPAAAHVLTDQPIYTPGSTVRMRALLLRRPDWTPLDGRPGRWHVRDANGVDVLAEKDAAGAFGVADTALELAPDAAVGTWTAMFVSGDATDTVTFDVSPFRLPRVTLEANADKLWYRVGEMVTVKGTARYASGAPVASAPVVVRLHAAEGDWPMPIAWERPFTATTDAWGRFTVPVGLTPPDLVGFAAIDAAAEVTDDAGETVGAHARIALSQHEHRVSAVTELGDGLVPKANNRVYLRVTTPDGQALASRKILVTRAWRDDDKGYEATTDVDGVASVQIDPGDPVTVVLPQQPIRFRPPPVTPTRLDEASGFGDAGGVDLDARRAVDALLPAVRSCADRAVGDAQVRVVVRVAPDGRVIGGVATADDALNRCVLAAAEGLRAPPGGLRTWSLAWTVGDPRTPWLEARDEAVLGDATGPGARVRDAARAARRCLPDDLPSGGAIAEVHWSVAAGQRALDATVGELDGAAVSPDVRRCVAGALRDLRPLAEAAPSDLVGVTHLDVALASGTASGAPGPSTITGYELRIAAIDGEARVGDTPLVMTPGAIPPLRLRPEPPIVAPGGSVTVTLVRGPGFVGELPKKLELHDGSGRLGDPVDVVDQKVTFAIPADADGILNVPWGDARALVFVRRTDPLALSITPDKAAYRPGETATLSVKTTAGGVGVPAGVGLVGVDQTLGQLAPLLGPDAYGRVTADGVEGRMAFGVFDAKGLVLGRIRGENAAMATLIGVTSTPSRPFGDTWAWASGSTVDDDASPLADAFWRGAAALQAKVGAWEASAPAGDVLDNARVAAWWTEVLDEERAAGRPVVDAFDRELTLRRLPPDLLARLDPRGLVDDATRLPEDVVDWRAWVAEEIR